ncbi:MAG TPA: type I phosphomannose isomerase catalytic subunit [Terriglobales bacterium]|nr:type I phosphomannose isomerase catalytic subunit [Terriglobales bacterium]
MPELYPLLLLPEFYERPWGARSLAPIYDKRAEKEPIGEAWLTGDACKVANGPLRGRTLGELAKEFDRALIGENAPTAGRFPLLIKFLFPRQKLSVQVHPDDEGARRIGQPSGKTECWYVLAAEKGAQVGLGLKRGTTREDFRRAISETRAETLLNWIDVHAGDMIYVDAGTVHAIGPGSILVETQQNSDTTYRLYDYGRPRPLHVEEGMAATKEKTHAGKVRRAAESKTLIDSPCFRITRQKLERSDTWASPAGRGESPRIVVALEGSGRLEARGHEAVSFSRGEAVVVPAAAREFAVHPQWQVEFLTMELPVGKPEHPEAYIDDGKAVTT